MQIIDLSTAIDDKAFEVHKVAIDRVNHVDGVEKFNRVIMGKTWAGKLKYFLGQRIVKKGDLPDGEFLSLEVVHAPVHVGTHLDYSYHYGSRSQGQASKTAEEIPLENCYCDGVRLDMRHKRANEVISAQDVDEALKKINYSLKKNDIVLFYTGADKHIGSPKYFSEYPGIDPSAIDYLLDREVKIFGVDTMGIDRPYKFMLKEFLEERKPLYPAHFHGRKREFIHIERLAHLDKIPAPYGFKVICFPVKIKNTGAAWARVVAVVEKI